MTISTEVIRKITIQGSAPGVPQATAELNKLNAAQENLAVTSDTSSKRALSAEQAYNRQTLSVVAGARAQAELEKSLRTAKSALDQGIITTAEHATRVGLLHEKYGQASVGAKAFAAATSGVSGQLIALSAGAGPVGVFLSALGPLGIAAAVGIGLVGAAIAEVREVAASAGQKARDLQELSDATLRNVDQLRGLKKIAAEFGAGDKIEAWLQRASISTEKATLGSGELVDALNKISPAFQRQMEATTTFAERLDVLSAAARYAKEQGKDVALFWKDVFGARASGRADPVFTAVELAGGVTKIGEAMQKYAGTTSAEIDQRAALARAIEEEQKKYDSLKATLLGATTALELELVALQSKTAALTKLLAVQSAVLLSQQEQIKSYSDEKRAIDEVREAEEAREAAVARIGGRRGRQALAVNKPYISAGDPPFMEPAPVVPTIESVTGKTRDYAKEAEQAFNATKKWMDMLGAVATIQETATQSLKKLEMEFLNQTHGVEDATKALEIYNRAKAAIELTAQAQATQGLIGVLGVMAPIQLQMIALEERIAQARQRGIAVTDAQAAGIKQLALEQAIGISQIKAQIDSTTVQAATLGMSAGAAAEFAAVQTKLNEAIRNKAPLDAAQEAALRKEAAGLRLVTQADAERKAALDASFNLQTVFLSDIDKQIAQVQRQLHGNAWPQYMNDGLAATMRITSTLKELNDFLSQSLASAFKDLAKHADPGKVAGDLAKKLAESVIDIATKRLVGSALGSLGSLFGDTAGAAVGATTAAGILTTAGATLAAQMVAGATEAAAILAGGGVTAGAEVATGGAVAGTTMAVGGTTAATELEIAAPIIGLAINGPIVAAIAAIAAAAALLFSFGSGGDDGIAKVIKDWQDAMRRAFDYDQRRLRAQSDGSLASQLQLFDRDAAKQRFEELEKGGFALAHLEGALAAERIQIITDFNKQAEDRERQHQEEIAKRQMSAQDRLFAASNDNDSLAGQLAAQARQFERERLEEQKSGNEAITDLVAAQQAEELALRKSFNDKIIDETKRAEEARLTALNGAAKTVVDYLAGLQSGPNATVSPLDNLTNSQALYNANLALAQGGNIDAQNKWSSLAENLRLAARSVYASGQGYQDILNQITSQGLALPAVQQTTDPAVIELRNVVAAINAGNATQALDATLQNVIKSAIDAGNAAAFAAAITPKFDQLNTTADQGLTFAELVAGVNGLARDTTTSGLLTQAQIDSLGFSRDATVGQLLTQSQLSALGLSRDATVSALDTGNLLRIFREMDGDGNGILERSEAIRAWTQGVFAQTAGIYNQTGGIISQTGDVKNEVGGVKSEVVAGNTIESSISSSATRIVNAINAQGKLAADVGEDHSKKLADIAQFTLASAAKAIGSNPGGGSGGTFSWLGFEKGGIAPPYSTFIYGEHHPQGPFVGRAGADPIPITPAMPSFRGEANDNSEIRALRQEVRELKQQLTTVLLSGFRDVVRAEGEAADQVRAATKEGARHTAFAIVQNAKDNKAA